MPLTRASEFPCCMLLHDKHGAPAAKIYFYGRLQRPISNFNAPPMGAFLFLENLGYNWAMGFFSKFSKKEEIKSVGTLGEETAARYLKKKGYKILCRNYKNPFGYRLGELDIIVRNGKEIIFVEVKTRIVADLNLPDILPEEQITRSKLHKLERIASCYLNAKKLKDSPYRFDAVSVWLSENLKEARIKHIDNIFF